MLRRSTSAGATSMTVYAFGLEEHLYNGTGVHQSDTYYYMLGGMLVGESTGTTLSTYQQAFSYDSLDRMASGPAGSVTYGDINHVHAATSLGSMPNPLCRL